MRRYDGLAQQDPQGPVFEGPEAPRVQRGGSWFNSAGWARSAYRRALRPGLSDDYLGFRLCLRSIEPGQAQWMSSGLEFGVGVKTMLGVEFGVVSSVSSGWA